MASTSTTSKSALKKEAKRLEKEAKVALKAAKSAVAANNVPGNSAAGEKEKKVKEKEKKEEEVYVNTTPKGEKKDLSGPLAQGYNPIAVESAWYDWWQAQNFFKPEYTPPHISSYPAYSSTSPFVIPAPPPNVTGSLHIGHALTVAIQDSLVRWNRMLGRKTLFVPGFDHAGISTQSVVEKRLLMKGITRHHLGREKFLEVVMQWKDEYQQKITNQLHRLGGSYDWDRVAFTMNESLSKAVIETFCRLHEDGIIYRANRLVNWCCALNTTLSNLEVEQKEIEGRTYLSIPGYDPSEKFEFGVLVHFAYELEPLPGSPSSDTQPERLIIATTRPETMLGDTGIAVHPADERYTHLKGSRFAKHPFVKGRRLPIIFDEFVDPAFGTGAVKLTPAHDPVDNEVGKRHGLEFVSIFELDGTLKGAEVVGERFKGMKRFHARGEVVKALQEKGLLVGKEPHRMVVPVCAKSGDVIEPIVMPQWWVDCGRLIRGKGKEGGDGVVERTRKGEMRISPRSSENEWFRWLAVIQDWCISRQLWWGHRCPAYFVKLLDHEEEQDRSDGRWWVVGRTRDQAEERARTLVGEGRKFELEQDEDVLDTWFSSALWPFSIFGWPDKEAKDLKEFYPATILETGWDILFFWVARMVMMGVYLTDSMPFGEVYCHAMVRDAHGRKMSKSLGNVVDPIDVIEGISLTSLHDKLEEGNLDKKEIEKAKAGQKKDFPRGIAQCGSDALRFALCNYSGGGRDINLEILRVEGYRKFCNKVWNAVRFVEGKFGVGFEPLEEAKPTGNESLVEKWILHKLNIAATELNHQMAERNFMAATNAVYNFWLYELCDVYIEASKPLTDPSSHASVQESARHTLYLCLDYALRMLHPFMPFLTEELWQRLARRSGDETPSIMVSKFPVKDSDFEFEEAEKQFDLVFSTLKMGRSLAASYTLQNDIQFFIQVQADTEADLFKSQLQTIVALTKGCKSAKVVRSTGEIPAGCGSAVVTPTVIMHTLVKACSQVPFSVPLLMVDLNLDNQGLIDLENEIAKCDKKLDIAQMNLQKVLKIMSVPDYKNTVPENVHLINEEKKLTVEAEISTLLNSRNMFTRLQ